MENLTEISNNKSELNGQNIPFNQPDQDLTSKLFSIENLNKQFLPANNIPIKRYKSEKIKKFLSKEEVEEKKKLIPIKEIVIDDQNEKVVSNNPKKLFMVKEENNFGKNNDNKKTNLIEELRNFDRKMQMNMENYINKIKQKKFQISYNKNLKNNYEKLNFDFSLEPTDNININNGINNTSSEKDINNTFDDFEKLKQKYFCQNIYSSKFPYGEYKIKYLNNYFNKDPPVRNMFRHNKEPQPQLDINDINNINNSNNINTSPTNVHFNSSINNNAPFKPAIKLNQSCNNIIVNNRYSEQSLNNMRCSMKSNKYINHEIEKKYNEVFNSIDQRLSQSKYKKKYKNIDNIKLMKVPSSERIKTNTNINVHKRINCGFNFFRVTNNFFYRNSIL